jgi:hypothetical protein
MWVKNSISRWVLAGDCKLSIVSSVVEKFLEGLQLVFKVFDETVSRNQRGHFACFAVRKIAYFSERFFAKQQNNIISQNSEKKRFS